MLTPKQQMSESLTLGILLTLAGGFQDAYSYNCRGSVFANAQTGNIVLFGQNLASGNLQQAIRYLFPILAFLTGVYITEWIRELFKQHEKIHWRQIILFIEIVLLIIAGLLPQRLNILSNILMSFSCAMQVNSFRKFKGIPCATTMCIGNMRSGTQLLCQYHITKNPELKEKSYYYFFIIFIFALGASIGALLTFRFGERAIWIAALLLILGIILMFCNESEDKSKFT